MKMEATIQGQPHDPQLGSALRVDHVNDIAFVASTLVEGLRAARCDARLLRPATPGAGLRYPAKLLTMPLRGWPIGETALRLRFRRADVVHVHYATQALPAVLSGRPFVVHCHGTDIRGVRPGTWRHRALKSLMRRAAAVLYSTPDLEEPARDLHVDAAFLPNPVDTTKFIPAGDPDVDVLVGTKLDPVKGADSIIAVIELIKELRPETTFTVIAQGRYVDRTQKAAGPFGRLVAPVPHHDMPELMQRHRAAIGQFELGSLGQFELEAMSTGLTVATSLRFHGSYTERPPLLPASTPEEAAQSIVRILDDPERYELEQAEARRWVRKYHDVNIVVSSLITTYLSLLSRSGRTSDGESG